MHQLIYAIVGAPTEHDALAVGQSAFDRLVGADPHAGIVFDYYVTFDDDSSRIAGPARWGDLPVVATIDFDEGEELFDRGWNATEEAFQQNLERVKEALAEHSDDAIMRDEGLTRHAFHQVGAYEGPSIYLYDEHGSGIRDRDQIDCILDESENCWIVPADVHY